MIENWETALAGFQAAQRAAGRSKGTIRTQGCYLTRLAALTPAPTVVTTTDLITFLGVEDWKPETRRSARTAVRSFFRWAHGLGLLDENPAEPLATVKIPPAEVTPYRNGSIRRR